MTPIRPAQSHEAAEVTRLIVGFRDWLADAAPSEGSIARSVERLLGDADTEFLLARFAAGDPACGFCQLRYRHSVWTGSPDCWLEDLYVEDRARRGGVGRALVLAALERAAARGARRIELDTNEENHAAIALYESLGFSATSKAHGLLQGRDVFMGRRVGG